MKRTILNCLSLLVFASLFSIALVYSQSSSVRNNPTVREQLMCGQRGKEILGEYPFLQSRRAYFPFRSLPDSTFLSSSKSGAVPSQVFSGVLSSSFFAASRDLASREKFSGTAAQRVAIELLAVEMLEPDKFESLFERLDEPTQEKFKEKISATLQTNALNANPSRDRLQVENTSQSLIAIYIHSLLIPGESISRVFGEELTAELLAARCREFREEQNA
ncbi:MAG: hypothetical protein KDD64_13355 [Bdellovibrionales bacterium]|nr:hypothetical protein [Bdellovibrionales bacterium]